MMKFAALCKFSVLKKKCYFHMSLCNNTLSLSGQTLISCLIEFNSWCEMQSVEVVIGLEQKRYYVVMIVQLIWPSLASQVEATQTYHGQRWYYIFAMGIIICRDIQLLKVVNMVVEWTDNLTRKFNLDYSCISAPQIDVKERLSLNTDQSLLLWFLVVFLSFWWSSVNQWSLFLSLL